MDEQAFAAIIADVSSGEATRNALATAGVNPRKFYAELDADEDKAKRYARAKDAQCTAMEEELIDIADAREGDVMVDDNGRRIIDNEAVQRARLRVDTRKWVLSKRIPRKYGEKLELAGDAAAPLVINITGTDSKL